MIEIEKLEKLAHKGMRWRYYKKLNKGLNRLSKKEFSHLLATVIIKKLKGMPVFILGDIKYTCSRPDKFHLQGYIEYADHSRETFVGHVVWMAKFNTYRFPIEFRVAAPLTKTEKILAPIKELFSWKPKKC